MARVLTVTIDAKGAVTGGKLAKQAIQGVGEEATRLGGRTRRMNGSMGRATTAFASMTRGGVALKGALAVVITGALIQQVLAYADSWTLIGGRLKLVTKGATELKEAQEQLFKISQDTSTAFAANATFFTRVSRAQGLLNVSSTELFDITKALALAVRVSGANAQEASSGILQLSQSMQSGRLAGEEFRAVSESMPIILDLIAKEMGVTRGALKKLGAEGKISSEVIAQALLKGQAELERQAKLMPKTLGQAMTELKNSTLQFAGLANEATGSTSALADVISDLAQAISEVDVDVMIGNLASSGRWLMLEFYPVVANLLQLLGMLDERLAGKGILTAYKASLSGLYKLASVVERETRMIGGSVVVGTRAFLDAEEAIEKYNGELSRFTVLATRVEAGAKATAGQIWAVAKLYNEATKAGVPLSEISLRIAKALGAIKASADKAAPPVTALTEEQVKAATTAAQLLATYQGEEAELRNIIGVRTLQAQGLIDETEATLMLLRSRDLLNEKTVEQADALDALRREHLEQLEIIEKNRVLEEKSTQAREDSKRAADAEKKARDEERKAFDDLILRLKEKIALDEVATRLAKDVAQGLTTQAEATKNLDIIEILHQRTLVDTINLSKEQTKTLDEVTDAKIRARQAAAAQAAAAQAQAPTADSSIFDFINAGLSADNQSQFGPFKDLVDQGEAALRKLAGISDGIGSQIGGAVGQSIGTAIGTATGIPGMGPLLGKLGEFLGALIGSAIERALGPQRIELAKRRINEFFGEVTDNLDFDILDEQQVASGLARFGEQLSAGAQALGAAFAIDFKKGGQGILTRFGGQLLANAEQFGFTFEETKRLVLELADAVGFELVDAIENLNRVTADHVNQQGHQLFGLVAFNVELDDARRNLSQYADTTNLTVSELNALASAHGNTGSRIATLGDSYAGLIDIASEFSELVPSQAIVAGLFAERLDDLGRSSGVAAADLGKFVQQVQDGTLVIEEALVQLQGRGFLLGLDIGDFTIDAEVIEREFDKVLHRIEDVGGPLGAALAASAAAGITDSEAIGEAFEEAVQEALFKTAVADFLAEEIPDLLAGMDFSKPIDLGSEAFIRLKERASDAGLVLHDILETAGLLPDAFAKTSFSSLQKSLTDAIRKGIQDGIDGTFDSALFAQQVKAALMTPIIDAITTAIIAGFIKGSSIEGLLQPLIDVIKRDLPLVASGDLDRNDLIDNARTEFDLIQPKLILFLDTIAEIAPAVADMLRPLLGLPDAAKEISAAVTGFIEAGKPTLNAFQQLTKERQDAIDIINKNADSLGEWIDIAETTRQVNESFTAQMKQLKQAFIDAEIQPFIDAGLNAGDALVALKQNFQDTRGSIIEFIRETGDLGAGLILLTQATASYRAQGERLRQELLDPIIAGIGGLIGTARTLGKILTEVASAGTLEELQSLRDEAIASVNFFLAQQIQAARESTDIALAGLQEQLVLAEAYRDITKDATRSFMAALGAIVQGPLPTLATMLGQIASATDPDILRQLQQDVIATAQERLQQAIVAAREAFDTAQRLESDRLATQEGQLESLMALQDTKFQEEQNALQTLANTARNVADAARGAREGFLLSGQSTLGARPQLGVAQAAFDEAREAGLGGDAKAGRRAIGLFSDLASLTQKAFAGTSQGQTIIEDALTGLQDLETLFGKQATEAELQIEVTEEGNDTLVKIAELITALGLTGNESRETLGGLLEATQAQLVAEKAKEFDVSPFDMAAIAELTTLQNAFLARIASLQAGVGSPESIEAASEALESALEASIQQLTTNATAGLSTLLDSIAFQFAELTGIQLGINAELVLLIDAIVTLADAANPEGLSAAITALVGGLNSDNVTSAVTALVVSLTDDQLQHVIPQLLAALDDSLLRPAVVAVVDALTHPQLIALLPDIITALTPTQLPIALAAIVTSLNASQLPGALTTIFDNLDSSQLPGAITAIADALSGPAADTGALGIAVLSMVNALTVGGENMDTAIDTIVVDLNSDQVRTAITNIFGLISTDPNSLAAAVTAFVSSIDKTGGLTDAVNGMIGDLNTTGSDIDTSVLQDLIDSGSTGSLSSALEAWITGLRPEDVGTAITSLIGTVTDDPTKKTLGALINALDLSGLLDAQESSVSIFGALAQEVADVAFNGDITALNTASVADLLRVSVNQQQLNLHDNVLANDHLRIMIKQNEDLEETTRAGFNTLSAALGSDKVLIDPGRSLPTRDQILNNDLSSFLDIPDTVQNIGLLQNLGPAKSSTSAGGNGNAPIVININGASQSPQQIASVVIAEIKKRKSHNEVI